ncbi:ABC transporter family substrate-binding protein [Corynebacterium lizhenjunii]|uniref:ABC transporter family substrate-binding protein n=1 Tax=Corynebacterium lizhenjunii TaxID=2709394 RepID=A0A7T0KEX1_9CORY|nr:ABC transporter family substrate-binding protein [Corynebacterium lizhenjunii]QPK79538.1 ABC transporter family substrate-binding protein [Corynebacterium lizhenjunii]
MKKFDRLRLVGAASVTAAALVLAGCSGASDSGSSNGSGDKGSASSAPAGLDIEIKPAGDINPKSRDEIQDGGELTLALGELTEQQNRFHANMTTDTSGVWNWYNPELTMSTGEGEWSPNPDYLTDAKEDIVDGNTVVTYTINEKAVYNDGTPIDWKSFENTWKFNNGKDYEVEVNSTDGYEQIKSVERGKSDKEVVVTFDGAYPWWQGLFNYLLHPAIDSAEKFDNEYLGKVRPEWGAGPFKVESSDFKAGTITFVPNEKWWGDAPKLDKVTFRAMESQAVINAFQAGEIDAAGVASKNNLKIAADMGDKIDIRASLRTANVLFTLNSRAPQLKDVNVRHAIFAGIDRAQLATIRYNGLGYEEELPGSLTLYSIQEDYQDNLSDVLKFDPEESRKLLEGAGYSEGADGYYEKDGERLTLRYVLVGDDEVSKSTAAAIQKMQKDIGVEVKIEERPSSEFSKILAENDFDLFLSGIFSSDPYGVAYFGQTYLSA